MLLLHSNLMKKFQPLLTGFQYDLTIIRKCLTFVGHLYVVLSCDAYRILHILLLSLLVHIEVH